MCAFYGQVDDSETIGVQTNVKLKVQTETMKSINDDIHRVQVRYVCVCVCVCVCVYR